MTIGSPKDVNWNIRWFQLWMLCNFILYFFYRGHPIVFTNLQGKQIVYSCGHTQQ